LPIIVFQDLRKDFKIRHLQILHE